MYLCVYRIRVTLQLGSVATLGDQYLGLGCTVGGDYAQLAAVYFGIALALASLFAVAACTYLALASSRRRVASRMIRTLTVIIFFIHPTITSQALEAYHCFPIHSLGTEHLYRDVTVRCDSSQHASTQHLAAASLALFSVAVPLSVFIAEGVIRYRDGLVVEHKMFTFLSTQYRPKRFYWELLIMARKVAIVAIAVFAANEPLFQSVLGLLLLVASLALHSSMRPFLRGAQWHALVATAVAAPRSVYAKLYRLLVMLGPTRLETWCLAANIVSLAAGPLFNPSLNLRPWQIEFLTYIVMILNAPLALVAVLVLLTMLAQVFTNVRGAAAAIILKRRSRGKSEHVAVEAPDAAIEMVILRDHGMIVVHMPVYVFVCTCIYTKRILFQWPNLKQTPFLWTTWSPRATMIPCLGSPCWKPRGPSIPAKSSNTAATFTQRVTATILTTQRTPITVTITTAT